MTRSAQTIATVLALLQEVQTSLDQDGDAAEISKLETAIQLILKEIMDRPGGDRDAREKG